MFPGMQRKCFGACSEGGRGQRGAQCCLSGHDRCAAIERDGGVGGGCAGLYGLGEFQRVSFCSMKPDFLRRKQPCALQGLFGVGDPRTQPCPLSLPGILWGMVEGKVEFAF